MTDKVGKSNRGPAIKPDSLYLSIRPSADVKRMVVELVQRTGQSQTAVICAAIEAYYRAQGEYIAALPTSEPDTHRCNCVVIAPDAHLDDVEE